MRRLASLVAATMLAALGCASGPTYSQLAASMPPVPPDQGRLYVFLTGATEIPGFFPSLTLDGAPIGELRPGSYLSVDRPPGVHTLGVYVKQVDAAFGTQGKTEPTSVPLAPGGTYYVEADVVNGGGMVLVTFTPVSAADAQRDLADLRPAPQPATP